MSNPIGFLLEFLKSPATTGAIHPSSDGLSRAITEWIDWEAAGTVVEYGPGTGVFTQRIVSVKQQDTRFLAVEINECFVEQLRHRFPSLCLFHDSVENVRVICNQLGIKEVDAIICGLPWASFSKDAQERYLDAMMSVLREGGQFGTFAYLQGLLLPAGWRFRQTLRQRFKRVETSPTIWKNIPPAFVYRCWR